MIDQMCSIASQAGDITMRFYRRSIHVLTKGDSSPLSEADQASHDYLLEALDNLTPGTPVISEESAGERTSPSGKYWLVDPLDGTKEFLKGTNEFTVNIALIEAGRPVMGVVYAPALSLTYYGNQATGAWRKSENAAAVRIHTRSADQSRLSIVASKDHAGPQVAKLLARAPGAELKSMGSSLKFCLVAEGAADLYLRDVPTMEWDTAAAQAIVEAAGGSVYDLSGNPLGYGKENLRNPAIMTVGSPTFPWKNLLS
jgi:3'(2'), 5'-bisphosphate nucleotidase